MSFRVSMEFPFPRSFPEERAKTCCSSVAQRDTAISTVGAVYDRAYLFDSSENRAVIDRAYKDSSLRLGIDSTGTRASRTTRSAVEPRNARSNIVLLWRFMRIMSIDRSFRDFQKFFKRFTFNHRRIDFNVGRLNLRDEIINS